MKDRVYLRVAKNGSKFKVTASTKPNREPLFKGYTTLWKGRKHTKKAKEKMSKNNVWRNRRNEIIGKYFKNKKSIPAKHEDIFAIMLKKNNISFKQQAVINNKYQVDFLLPGNVIVEIDGKWHNKKDDIIRDTYLKQHGYDVFRIKNKELIINETT